MQKKASAAQSKQQADRWLLQAFDVPEWLAWLDEQKSAANITGDSFVFVQVQLDGSVRSSGLGIPPWERFCGDLAPLDDIRTKFTDGLGR